jgi:hypothetical protein
MGNPKQPSRERPRKEQPREHTALTAATHAGGRTHNSEQKKGEAQRAARKPFGAQDAKLEISKRRQACGRELSAPGPGSR